MKYSRKHNMKYSRKHNKSKIGGIGTFFPNPPKNKEAEITMLTNDIGRVQLKRIEKSLKIELDKLKQLRKYCMSGCKIESCMYKNQQNCNHLGNLTKTKSNIHVGNYCSKKFKNLTCRNYVSQYNKMKFYLNYISNVNQNCQDLLNNFDL